MVKPKNKHSLSHVRHDPAHCLAPGLFRALKRGERKRSKLDVTYDYGDGKRIEFSGPEPLGADDLRILQGLVAMAGPNGLVLGPEPKTEGGRQLRLFLEPKWEAVTADAMVVKGSYRALAKEIGAEVDSGGALKHIQDCIERLWKVSIIAQNGRKRQGFRLLSEYASNEADGRLYVALNPLIAQAVMGRGQHVRISMDEVRALDNDHCILFIRGELPVMDRKYDILKHPGLKLTEDGGAAPYIHCPGLTYALEDLPLSTDSWESIEIIE